MTAFKPGQSPPPVNIAIFMVRSKVNSDENPSDALRAWDGLSASPKRGISSRREGLDYHQRGGNLLTWEIEAKQTTRHGGRRARSRKGGETWGTRQCEA